LKESFFGVAEQIDKQIQIWVTHQHLPKKHEPLARGIYRVMGKIVYIPDCWWPSRHADTTADTPAETVVECV